MIKTIIFDIGGVITHMDFELLYANFGERIGIGANSVLDYYMKNMKELILGNISFADSCSDFIAAGANASLDFKQIWIDEATKLRTVNQELLSTISDLRKHYLVSVLSNLTESRLILDNAIHLYDNFDYAVLSCTEHKEKPDPEFYKLALARASVKPEESVFIDDKEKCLAPARELGMHAILYSDNEGLAKEFKLLGVGM